MSSAGFSRPGLECQNCGLPFALSLTGVVTQKEIDALDDPFSIVCPMCKYDGDYPKAAIHSLYSTGQ